MLDVGDRAPDFDGTTDDGSKCILYDLLKTMNVVLYFYPRDFTPGCATEACGFRDNNDAIAKLGAVVMGISADNICKHKRFKEKYAIPFPLISDHNRKIIKLYQAERRILGTVSIKRVTYVIDKSRTIRGAFHHELAIGHHQHNVIDLLKKLDLKEKSSC